MNDALTLELEPFDAGWEPRSDMQHRARTASCLGVFFCLLLYCALVLLVLGLWTTYSSTSTSPFVSTAPGFAFVAFAVGLLLTPCVVACVRWVWPGTRAFFTWCAPGLLTKTTGCLAQRLLDVWYDRFGC